MSTPVIALKSGLVPTNDTPAIPNVSLGTNGGPHDGTTLVEDGIDRLITAAPNRAVVIAASNSYDDGFMHRGQVASGSTADLAWDRSRTASRKA